jgi:hypothetical protein
MTKKSGIWSEQVQIPYSKDVVYYIHISVRKENITMLAGNKQLK